MIVTRQHPFTGETHSQDLPITQEQYGRWQNGELAQTAFPHLSSDEREFIITGLVPGEWDDTFNE